MLPCPASLDHSTAYDQETGRSRGFAHVEFAEASGAAAAVAKNGEVRVCVCVCVAVSGSSVAWFGGWAQRRMVVCIRLPAPPSDDLRAAGARLASLQIEMDGRMLRLDSSAGRGAGTPGRGGAQAAGAAEGTTVFIKGFDTSGESRVEGVALKLGGLG